MVPVAELENPYDNIKVVDLELNLDNLEQNLDK